MLLCVARDLGVRLREVAQIVGITERAAQRIVADLVEAGYLEREREGRRTRYSINPEVPLRHPHGPRPHRRRNPRPTSETGGLRARHPYAGRTAALATKHRKAEAVAPALARAPGLRIVVPDGVDTDQLGTFTGEIDRPGTPVQTALLKAQLGIQAAGLPHALSSEGAFGPHPHTFMTAGALEILAFVDAELDIEVIERQLTHHTNFAHLTTATFDASTVRFAERVGFPGHGLIVRPNAGDHGTTALAKGLGHRVDLAKSITSAANASPDGLARIETDMRAHRNPTRMRQIAQLARRLAARLTTLCPACQTPGYGAIGAEPGLPCAACGTPTDWIAREIDACARCDARSRRPRRDGLTAADPSRCPCCNP